MVVRGNWQSFPLESRSGAPLDIVACLETLDAAEMGDWAVQFRAHNRVYPVRLIALKKTRAATVREHERIRSQAHRKRRRPDPRSLQAAHYVYVITDLPPDVLPTAEALEIYRLRWQIEIAFKRLKSILKLDRLRAHEPRLAKTYLFGKLLTALILDELCASAVSFFPWGYPIFPDATLSLALADTTN